MFIIRPAQRQALLDSIRAPMHRRILGFLRETMPERTKAEMDKPLLDRIATADRRAMALGIKTERGITRFVALTFMIGPKFDEIPEMRAYFNLAKPNADEKVHWLIKVLAERKKSEQQTSLARGIIEGGRNVVGGILAALLSPFLQFATGALGMGGLMGGAEVGAGAEAAGGLAALGPIGWAVLGVAAVVVVGVIVYHEINKVDEQSESVSEDDAQDDTEECPKQSSSNPSPEGEEGPDPEESGENDQESGKFADESKLNDHFDRHGNDFGAETPEEYETQADKFNNGPKDPDTLEKVRPNGDTVRYNPKTDEFGVSKSDGTIKTYYKPDPAVHGYETNLDYFNEQ